MGPVLTGRAVADGQQLDPAATAVPRVEGAHAAPRALPPELSAMVILEPRQRTVIVTAALIVLVFLVIAPLSTLIGIMTVATIVYLSTVTHRVLITRRSLREPDLLSISDLEARALPDNELPVYTVLVPAYHEAQVMKTLLTNLGALEYPRDRLDVKLLLEADDDGTIAAAMKDAVGTDVEIVLIPPGVPRTKPRALNYGLTLARGDLVTIFDAEDCPDPLQLRRAVAAFRRLPPDVVCLQAQLTFHNTTQNIITRWFTIEYLMWFTLFLPGLASTDAPVPLGGTSNHMRREALESIGAWDAFNVTEDADLGVRLHRLGLRTAVLDSVTFEEANSDFVNWVKQRSRWYKGYLQTWLVHLRHPVELWRALGTSGFVQFNLFVGGTPILALLNPLFWFLTLAWFLGKVSLIEQIFPAPLYHLAMVCWILGNFTIVYLTILAARRSEQHSLVWAACLVPAYWVMMSLAAIKAFWQIITAPSFWEKTTHGLSDGVVVPALAIDANGAAATPTVTGAMSDGASAPRVVAFANVDTSEGHPPQWSGIAGGLSTLDRSDFRLPDQDRATRRRVALAKTGQRLRVGGLVAVAFLAFLVIGTGFQADQAQHDLGVDLDAAVPTHRPPTVGDPIARLTVPGSDVNAVVVEGASRSELTSGPGHVRGTANPGGKGNVVIIGHRSVAGAPFAHLDDLHADDIVEMTTPWGEARYQVTRVSTVDAGNIDLTARGRPRLTLVTSSTSLGSSGRVVVDARLLTRRLVRTPPRAAVKPALPGTDQLALPLVVAWGFAVFFAWRARRWLQPRWGRVGGALLVAPFVLFGVYEAFSAGVRMFAPTF